MDQSPQTAPPQTASPPSVPTNSATPAVSRKNARRAARRKPPVAPGAPNNGAAVEPKPIPIRPLDGAASTSTPPGNISFVLANSPAGLAANPLVAPPARRWPLWTAVSVLCCLVATIGGAHGTYLGWRGGEQIAPNVFISGEAVGGLTRREARERLQKRFGNLALTVRAPATNYQLTLRELGGAPDFNRAVNDAYWFGRGGDVWRNVPRVLMARFEEHHLRLPVRWNKERLKNRMRAVARSYYRPAHSAVLKVDGLGVHILPEESGRALNVGETLARLQRRYEVGYAAVTATERIVEPRLSAADLVGTDVKIAQFTTRFNRGLVGRTKNIHVASGAINGKVLMPGQIFSFNGSTGERTFAKGYRMAHIFERKPGEEESEIVDGLAGGTCQVSTTLYNAVRKSNEKLDGKLRIVQRETHSLPVPYIASGLDATVAWPSRDFKFKNTLPHPVFLRTAVAGSRLTISVWARVPMGTAPQLAQSEPPKRRS